MLIGVAILSLLRRNSITNYSFYILLGKNQKKKRRGDLFIGLRKMIKFFLIQFIFSKKKSN